MIGSMAVLSFYVPCSETFLAEKLEELPRYGWLPDDLKALQMAWLQIKDCFETGGNEIPVSTYIVNAALQLSIVKHYSSRFWFEAFAGQCKLPQSFRPYPDVNTLYAKDGKPHYLWLASELKEALLQLWLYVEQDEARFNQAVQTVWQQYRGYTKYECGYGGEIDKFANALRQAADTQKSRQ